MIPIRVLELRSVLGTGGGPEKTILAGAARASPHVAITVCYLRAFRDSSFTVDSRAAALGVDYVEIVERHSFDPRIWPALRRLIQSRRIQIVHAHDYKTDLLGLLLQKSDGIIPVATAHGWTGKTRRERAVYYPADKRLLARYPRVIAVSSEIARELLRTGSRPDRIVVAPNGIDAGVFRRDPDQVPLARHRLGVPAAAIIVGSVGRLERQKRFDRLIEAVAQLRTRWPGLHLLLAGEGSERSTIENLMRRRLGSAWTMTGYLDDVTLAYHAMDVFVQVSDYEGTSNALLEAMAMMTPLVATDVGGTRELVDEAIHGLLVDAGDAAALAGALERVLQDPEGARDRAAAARRRVEDTLSFDARTRRIEALYAELIKHRPARRPAPPPAGAGECTENGRA